MVVYQHACYVCIHITCDMYVTGKKMQFLPRLTRLVNRSKNWCILLSDQRSWLVVNNKWSRFQIF